jgi:hypothetical protein
VTRRRSMPKRSCPALHRPERLESATAKPIARCSATLTCVISHQTLFAMCTAPYLFGTTTMDPCIEIRVSIVRHSAAFVPARTAKQVILSDLHR